MPLIVREVLPPESNTTPREAHIGMLLHALEVPWLKERGPITVLGDYVYCDGLVVAKIEYDRLR